MAFQFSLVGLREFCRMGPEFALQLTQIWSKASALFLRSRIPTVISLSPPLLEISWRFLHTFVYHLALPTIPAEGWILQVLLRQSPLLNGIGSHHPLLGLPGPSLTGVTSCRLRYVFYLDGTPLHSRAPVTLLPHRAKHPEASVNPSFHPSES